MDNINDENSTENKRRITRKNVEICHISYFNLLSFYNNYKCIYNYNLFTKLYSEQNSIRIMEKRMLEHDHLRFKCYMLLKIIFILALLYHIIYLVIFIVVYYNIIKEFIDVMKEYISDDNIGSSIMKYRFYICFYCFFISVVYITILSVYR